MLPPTQLQTEMPGGIKEGAHKPKPKKLEALYATLLDQLWDGAGESELLLRKHPFKII